MSSQNGKIKVLIAAKERGVRDQLRQLVLADKRYEITGTAVDGQEASQLAVMLRPDIALVKFDLPIFNGFETSEMIGLAAPDVKSVIVGDGQADNQTLRKAMRSGARAYIASPIASSELAETLDGLVNINERKKSNEYQSATDPTRLPKIIIVTGGKGGIGKTTISASLSMCLEKYNPGKVLLFDLYTQFGDVSTMLNISPNKSLTDLVHVTDEIDVESLEDYIIEHETGIKILPTALSAQPIDAISVGSAENTIHALKRKYTYIVVDLPPIMHATTLYMLSHCHHLLLVTTMFDMPGIRDAKELYNIIVGNYVAEDKVHIIANRVSKFDRLTPDDLKNLLGRPASVLVPNDRRLVSAMNQGVPFVKAYSKSPLVAAIEKIALQLMPQEVQNKL